MKIPTNIQRKLVSASKHAAKCTQIMAEVDEYFESLGFTPEELRSGTGCSLEEFEYGNCPLKEFEQYLNELLSKDMKGIK